MNRENWGQIPYFAELPLWYMDQKPFEGLSVLKGERRQSFMSSPLSAFMVRCLAVGVHTWPPKKDLPNISGLCPEHI